MRDLCDAMKEARNNLFHGEKGSAERPRDKALLRAGVIAMNAMLEAQPDVKDRYWF